MKDSKPFVIIITGLPATGKTNLAKKISKEFSLPLICKDDFKEILFDILGYTDPKISKKIGIASHDLLYHNAEENLKAKKSFILESNFNPEFANKKILELKKKYNFIPFQIRCITDGKILFERFKKRANSGERHSGHNDDINTYEWYSILKKGKIEALKIGDKVFDIDTADFNKIDYQKLFNFIKNLM